MLEGEGNGGGLMRPEKLRWGLQGGRWAGQRSASCSRAAALPLADPSGHGDGSTAPMRLQGSCSTVHTCRKKMSTAPSPTPLSRFSRARSCREKRGNVVGLG